MVTFPDNVTVYLRNVRLKSSERYHGKAALCSGSVCGICNQYRSLWVQSESVKGHKRDSLQNEARAIKPIERFNYTSDQGEFIAGKFVHSEIERKGPNVSIQKTYVHSANEQFPFYKVEAL